MGHRPSMRTIDLSTIGHQCDHRYSVLLLSPHTESNVTLILRVEIHGAQSEDYVSQLCVLVLVLLVRLGAHQFGTISGILAPSTYSATPFLMFPLEQSKIFSRSIADKNFLIMAQTDRTYIIERSWTIQYFAATTTTTTTTTGAKDGPPSSNGKEKQPFSSEQNWKTSERR
eukprot:gene19972-1025_t